jgi:multiple sugar transport system permease protein
VVSALTQNPPETTSTLEHHRRLARRAGSGVRLSGNGPRLRFGGVPYLLLIPLGVFLLAFSLLPFLWALLISVQPPLGASSGQITGVTWANFQDILTDPQTGSGIVVTLLYAFVSTFFIIAFSIGSAIALANVRRGSGFYQLFLLIPLTLAPPVVVILWQAMFNPSSGAVNGVLRQVGLPAQGFYESTGQALPTIIAMGVWSQVGFWTLVFLSALRSLSSEMFEASEIDGAGPVRTFFSITLPLLKRTILLASVVLSTAGLVVFIPAQLLTQGGPGDSTRFLMYQAAQDVLRFGQPGSANAIVVLILLLIAIIAAVQFRLIRSEDA